MSRLPSLPSLPSLSCRRVCCRGTPWRRWSVLLIFRSFWPFVHGVQLTSAPRARCNVPSCSKFPQTRVQTKGTLYVRCWCLRHSLPLPVRQEKKSHVNIHVSRARSNHQEEKKVVGDGGMGIVIICRCPSWEGGGVVGTHSRSFSSLLLGRWVSNQNFDMKSQPSSIVVAAIAIVSSSSFVPLRRFRQSNHRWQSRGRRPTTTILSVR